MNATRRPPGEATSDTPRGPTRHTAGTPKDQTRQGNRPSTGDGGSIHRWPEPRLAVLTAFAGMVLVYFFKGCMTIGIKFRPSRDQEIVLPNALQYLGVF